jgi:hypothetical protein
MGTRSKHCRGLGVLAAAAQFKYIASCTTRVLFSSVTASPTIQHLCQVCLPACRRKMGSQHGPWGDRHMTKSTEPSPAGALRRLGQRLPKSERHTMKHGLMGFNSSGDLGFLVAGPSSLPT